MMKISAVVLIGGRFSLQLTKNHTFFGGKENLTFFQDLLALHLRP